MADSVKRPLSVVAGQNERNGGINGDGSETR